LWLGDFTAAIDKRWQIDNGIVAVLTVAIGLNIEPAEGVEHLVSYKMRLIFFSIRKSELMTSNSMTFPRILTLAVHLLTNG
jgi:hypothetical protein